jgi:hypothetical protein
MLKCVPDRRWKRLQYALTKQDGSGLHNDAWLYRVYQAVIGEEDDEQLRYLYELCDSSYHRDCIMAFLLSRATLDETSKCLEIPITIIQGFAKLLFDTDELRNKLDHILYAREYQANVAQEEGKWLIDTGLTGGPVVLQDRFLLGHEELNIDVRSVSRKMINTAYTIGMVARGNSLTSEASKQALRWFDSVTKLLAAHEKLRMEEIDDNIDDAVVAIKQHQLTHTPEELNLLPENIMH